MSMNEPTRCIQPYNAEWKCHTPRLLEEILNNPSCAILRIPINLFGKMLANVATRASKLNDPVLNKYMVQLTLYEVADPYSNGYDKNIVDDIFKDAAEYCVVNDGGKL